MVGVNLSQNGCFRKSDPFSSEDKFIFKKDDGSDGLTFTSAYTVGGLCCTVWYYRHYQLQAKIAPKLRLQALYFHACSALVWQALLSRRRASQTETFAEAKGFVN